MYNLFEGIISKSGYIILKILIQFPENYFNFEEYILITTRDLHSTVIVEKINWN